MKYGAPYFTLGISKEIKAHQLEKRTMERAQEEFQFLDFFGIFKESFTILSSWRKIFGQITVTLILPLSIIYLSHIKISHILFYKILHDEQRFSHMTENNPRHAEASKELSSEWTMYLLFKAAYITLYFILSLLSTSAVVYTIACIHSSKDFNFKKVIKVVPKVWKRLIVTFLWILAIFFIYNVVALLFLYYWHAHISEIKVIGTMAKILLGLAYLTGFVYISILWQLATVVSVLEESYGRQAMIKSKALIKGKMKLAVAVFSVVCFLFLGDNYIFEVFVVFRVGVSATSFVIGVLCVLFLVIIVLFGLVIQSVLYFVCKSYHHENIDRSLLAEHLEAIYLGQYVPLIDRNMELGEFQA